MTTVSSQPLHHKAMELAFASDALSPHISQQTIEYHYGKHYKGYLNKLNELVRGTEFENSSLDEIVKRASDGIYNNGAQVWNHEFLFEELSPSPQKAPTGKLFEAINHKWGSVERFKEEFKRSATALFGSGWVWLVEEPSGEVSIISEPNAGNPIRYGHKPLMVADVWEHAYYLDHRNLRADSIDSLWQVLDWDVVEKRYGK